MLRTNRHQIHPLAADTRPSLDPPTSSASHQPPPSPAPSPAVAGTHHPVETKAKLISFLLQGLIMALTASLFYFSTGLVAVMILFHLCLLGGALLRRCGRRSNHHYLLDFDSNIHSTTQPRFSPAELEELPGTRLARGSEDSCAICLEDLIDGDWCRELPDCKHAFHACCVDRWLAKAVVCPVCRTTVGIAAEEQPTEAGEEGGQLWSVFGYE